MQPLRGLNRRTGEIFILFKNVKLSRFFPKTPNLAKKITKIVHQILSVFFAQKIDFQTFKKHLK